MRISTGSGTRATMPPDPLERLLEAEASLADEYERANEDAERILAEAHTRAEVVLAQAAAESAEDRQAIATIVEHERELALAAIAAEAAAGVARYDLPDARIEALATLAVDALFDEIAREVQP